MERKNALMVDHERSESFLEVDVMDEDIVEMK